MLIPIEERTALTSPDHLFGLAVKALKTFDEVDQQKEIVFIFGVDTAGNPIYCDAVHIGTLNSSLVHPREVFRRAIEYHVDRIFFIHNHPSGNVEASDNDIFTTRQLKEAGKLLGIELQDSIIIGFKDGQAIYNKMQY